MPPKLPSTKAVGAKPAPVIRAQMDDSPPAVRIPTPEELGIGRVNVATSEEPLDWMIVERKLDAVGATGYQMEKTADGFRFTCKLASGPVAGRGATKGEAVRKALAQLSR